MNAIFQLLNPSNTVTVNRPLAHAIGLMETVIYGALVSKWNYYSEQGKLDDGWFYSTAADLEESTALTECQQKRCIDNLVELGLIKCEKRCMPAKRGFYIIDDIVLLAEYISRGEKKMKEIKPQAAKKNRSKVERRNRKKSDAPETECPVKGTQPAPLACSHKTLEQVPIKPRNKSPQNIGTSSEEISEQVPTKCRNNTLLYNLKEQSRDNNPNQSINPPQPNDFRDMIDRTDTDTSPPADFSFSALKEKNNAGDERTKYREQILTNIEYEYIADKEKHQVYEWVELMLDVMCSKSATVRANGIEVPIETVKSRFLSLENSHIEYVLDALKRCSPDIRNVRSYLITTLYNAPVTKDNFYGAMVNHDMYPGGKR